MLPAKSVIDALGLEPHPEGGYFRETFRDPHMTGERSVGTAIYFLLRHGEKSRWHRVDASEIWHWYAGAELELTIVDNSGHGDVKRLGNSLEKGTLPQAVVPAGQWQTARSLGSWTLVGCTVAPGFEFSGFELAPPDFNPAATG